MKHKTTLVLSEETKYKLLNIKLNKKLKSTEDVLKLLLSKYKEE